jgi:polyhydroxyalkanoate synthase
MDDLDALDAVEGGESVGIPTALGLIRGVLRAFMQPGPVAREIGQLGVNVAKVVRGTAEFLPDPKDKRFADPAWAENRVYRRWSQVYIAMGAGLTRLVDTLEEEGADWHEVERARFAGNIVNSALSPTNMLIGNPAALKRARETGGRSVLRGLGHVVSDIRTNNGMPATTDRSAFTVGADLAITPGAVVHRSAVAELLQYTPTTPKVRSRPLLVIPPPIGRYYFLDLRPGRSFVEYAVSQGLQVFLLSWFNPGPDESDWDIDTYAEEIRSAIEVVKEIAGSTDVNTLGFCAGGILQATVLNHLAAVGDTSVNAASFGVTLLDFDDRAPIGAFSSPRLLEMARGSSRRSGLVSAKSLDLVFRWMRPDDLVFNYVVNQWLMGNDPPVFDILAWNADGTNLPTALHEQFLDIFRDNLLAEPGLMKVLGTPIDLEQVTLPTFVTGAMTDHLTPWSGCYRTTTLLSGPSTFVLSNAGHIASLINPPGNPKASYLEGGPAVSEPSEWLTGATQRQGSWWTAWAAWEQQHSGALRAAPRRLGSAEHPALEPAPGGYVLDRLPDPKPSASAASAASR